MHPETMVKHYFKLIFCAKKETKHTLFPATEARIIGIDNQCASFILIIFSAPVLLCFTSTGA
jgi:hypothetical protein